ncbi:helix-turn-helix domain-containing protein [Streptomyces sp. NPDC048172]|uniref:helix-turn-helix domain-containing protein n=1 Tax=Streptomyces sp. NPDC048172 TaxID=3365505 RepID=UPI00371639B1
MAPRTSPTERQRRLGSEVRKMRVSAGMSAETAAGLLGVDRAKISNIENGIRTISPERLRTLACNCALGDDAYLEALTAMARPAKRGWWERYRGSLSGALLDIAELESTAPRMRSAHAVHIPGILQTSDQAAAVFRVVVPKLSEQETGLRLAFRMERQQILEGDDPPAYVGLVHEAALRMQFGGRGTAARQLQHLLALSERPNITLLAIPFSAGAFPGSGQTVNYMEGPVRQLDTVEVDCSHGAEFLSGEAQLSKYRAHLDWMEDIALSPQESRDFIRRIANEL